MKKFVSVMLALMLTFALCIPVAAATVRARYCGHCGSVLSVSSTESFLRYKTCTRDSTQKDAVYLVITTTECPGCDREPTVTRSQRVECDHYLTQGIELGK